jgi:hypothetical protein
MFRTFLLVGASAMALAATSAEALTFAYTGTIQHYTVATTGIYDVVAAGAHGGSNYQSVGGQGIAIGAHVALTAGTMLDIVVGGGFKRFDDDGYYANNPGGGGGSFVLAGTASPVVIGGGGGGAAGAYQNGASATASQNGTNGGGAQGGTGGSSGAGGQGGTHVGRYSFGYNGGGGGGLNSAGGDGQNLYSGGGGSGAPSFAGGHGIIFDPFNPRRFEGGFGGGGAGTLGAAGGGGGFSGGGGGGGSFGYGGSYDGFGVGGGGGSFTRADATDITAVLNDQADGNGYASIDLIPSAVPEPATWGLLTGGFGMIGAAMRRSWRRKARLA